MEIKEKNQDPKKYSPIIDEKNKKDSLTDIHKIVPKSIFFPIYSNVALSKHFRCVNRMCVNHKKVFILKKLKIIADK